MAFTIRLNETQQKKLKKIMKSLNIGTYNKTLIKMIERFSNDQEQLLFYRNKARELELEISEIRRLYQAKADLENRIDEIFNIERKEK